MDLRIFGRFWCFLVGFLVGFFGVLGVLGVLGVWDFWCRGFFGVVEVVLKGCKVLLGVWFRSWCFGVECYMKMFLGFWCRDL